jgi:hypothetical protein
MGFFNSWILIVLFCAIVLIYFLIANLSGDAMNKKIEDLMKDKEGRKTGQKMCRHTTLFLYWALKHSIPGDIAKSITSRNKRWIFSENVYSLL